MSGERLHRFTPLFCWVAAAGILTVLMHSEVFDLESGVGAAEELLTGLDPSASVVFGVLRAQVSGMLPGSGALVDLVLETLVVSLVSGAVALALLVTRFARHRSRALATENRAGVDPPP